MIAILFIALIFLNKVIK